MDMGLPGFNGDIALSGNQNYMLNKSYKNDPIRVYPAIARPCCNDCPSMCEPCNDCYASVGWNDREGVCRDICKPCRDCDTHCIPCIIDE
jgi:hypothetical protein